MRQGQKTLPIGINVRSSAVYAVQLARLNGKTTRIAALSEPLAPAAPGVDPLIHAMQRLLAQNSFSGRRVVTALPAADVEIRPLRLPAGITPGSVGFDQALLTEARSCLLYDPIEAVLDYLPFPQDAADADQRHMVLLIASRRERVNRFLAVFKEAGLECEHLEVAACAAARLLLHEHQGFYAIVDIDSRQTVISVAEAHRMLFSRTVKLGHAEWMERLSQALEISALAAQDLLLTVGISPVQAPQVDLEEAADSGLVDERIVPGVITEVCGKSFEQLVKEIRRTTDYFALLPGGGRVERIFLLGEVLPMGLETMLADRLQVSVGFGSSPVSFGRAENGRSSARWTIAAGLAMREN